MRRAVEGGGAWGAPAISRPVLGFFRGVVRRYFRRHFHAVRMSGRVDPAAVEGPLIVIGNHSSWWDPMVAFVLGEQLFPDRLHYAPMDARSLARYRILRRVGVFGVEPGSARGAVQLLRVGGSVLAQGGVLWATPQGRFADVREQPLAFKPGVAALAAAAAERHGACTVLPLAIEYVFWDERLPECLVRVGRPLRVEGGEESREGLERRLRAALEDEMKALAGLAMGRNPEPFSTILAGGAGTGGFYALGERLRSAVRGKRYVAEHTRYAVAGSGGGASAAEAVRGEAGAGR